jgi:hypothetical protein
LENFPAPKNGLALLIALSISRLAISRFWERRLLAGLMDQETHAMNNTVNFRLKENMHQSSFSTINGPHIVLAPRLPARRRRSQGKKHTALGVSPVLFAKKQSRYTNLFEYS